LRASSGACPDSRTTGVPGMQKDERSEWAPQTAISGGWQSNSFSPLRRPANRGLCPRGRNVTPTVASSGFRRGAHKKGTMSPLAVSVTSSAPDLWPPQIRLGSTCSSPATGCLSAEAERLWSYWSEALILVKPETVVSWHRAGFRPFWRWRCRTSTERPMVSAGFAI